MKYIKTYEKLWAGQRREIPGIRKSIVLGGVTVYLYPHNGDMGVYFFYRTDADDPGFNYEDDEIQFTEEEIHNISESLLNVNGLEFIFKAHGPRTVVCELLINLSYKIENQLVTMFSEVKNFREVKMKIADYIEMAAKTEYENI